MEDELYVKDGNLVFEDVWQQRIDSLKTKVPIKAATIEMLAKAIESAVINRAVKSGMGVMFSGGLDSSLICQILKRGRYDFKSYSVSVGSSHDAAASVSAARLLKLDHFLLTVGNDEGKDIIRQVALLLNDSNPVNVGVGTVTYSICKKASEEGVKVLFSGLGAEEIFAGYSRHRAALDINAECWAGLYSLLSRDLVRDFTISSHFGIKIMAPFLDSGLIALAMSVPGEEKYDGSIEKLAERKAALLLGLPTEIAERKKKAAQYGSNFDRLMGLLARKAGFKAKREYLASLLGQ
jgi:diphthine-ammonia ligase